MTFVEILTLASIPHHEKAKEENEPRLIDTTQLIIYLCLLIYLMVYASISLKRVFEKSYTWLRFLLLLVVSLVVFLLATIAWVLLIAWSYDLIET